MLGFSRRKKEKIPGPEIRPVEPEERRVYVLDFDRTITILHTGALAYGNELTPAFIQKNTKKGFEDFIHTIIKRGHTVYIASYNDDANADMVEAEALSGHALIKFYMDLAFGRDQTVFTLPGKNGSGEVAAAGNIIASNSQDLKQYHLNIIAEQEGLDQENPEDMKRIHLIEDDEDVVRFFMEKGCTTLVPFSASRSADTAATNTLFISYMPDSFIY